MHDLFSNSVFCEQLSLEFLSFQFVLGRHIHFVRFFIYFALLFSCTLHVRSLLVILLFSVTVFQWLKRVEMCTTIFVKDELGLGVWSIVMSSDAAEVNLSNSAGKTGQPVQSTSARV